MSSAVVWFLRHGRTEGGARYWGRTDVALAADGFRQMEEATVNLAVDRIVTSPLQRCRTFAEHLSGRRGIPCHVELRLVEMDFGAWDGRAAHDIFAEDREALERFWRDPLRHAPPGAEPCVCPCAEDCRHPAYTARRRAGPAKRIFLQTRNPVRHERVRP